MQEFTRGKFEKKKKDTEKHRSASPPPKKVSKKGETNFSFFPKGVPPGFELGSGHGFSPSDSASKEEESASTDIAVFGHGYFDPNTTIKAPHDIVLYGPYGSTLTRAVSKWIREKPPLKPGNLKLITISTFESLQLKYGIGASFDKAVWDAAEELDKYPCTIKQGEDMPSLLLDIQEEEEVSEAKNVITATKRTFLEEIGKQAKEGAVLHWAACLQNIGMKKILDTDKTVLLHPKLAAEVYPQQTRDEAQSEKNYQKVKEQEKKMESTAKTFVSRRPQVTRSIDHKNKLEEKINEASKGNPALLESLKNTTFSAPEKIDEDFLTKLAKEYDMGTGFLRTYIIYYVIDKSPLS